MHRRWMIIWLIVLLAGGLCFPIAPALAGGSPPDDDGITIWNDDYTLEEGEQLDGDLVVFNGDVTLEVDSCVAGSVIVWNGSADANGTIEGDLVVSSGDVHLGSDAQVEGDVVCTWDCGLDQEDGSRVDGGIVEGVPLDGLRSWRWGHFQIPMLPPLTFWLSGPGQVLDWVFGAIRGLVAILVVAAVGGLVALIWPQQMALVGRTVIESPMPSFGIGLLTAFAGVALVGVLLITICLSPIAVLMALALGVAGLFGWIGVGALVGERLMRALNASEAAPLWAAGLGTLVITLVTVGLGLIPCLGLLGVPLVFGLGCLGLGAVVLTRFGATAYTTSRPAPLQ